MLSILTFKMIDEPGEHLGNLFVLDVQVDSFRLADVLAVTRDSKLSAHFSARTFGSVAVLGEMTIGRLFRSF